MEFWFPPWKVILIAPKIPEIFVYFNILHFSLLAIFQLFCVIFSFKYPAEVHIRVPGPPDRDTLLGNVESYILLKFEFWLTSWKVILIAPKILKNVVYFNIAHFLRAIFHWIFWFFSLEFPSEVHIRVPDPPDRDISLDNV